MKILKEMYGMLGRAGVNSKAPAIRRGLASCLKICYSFYVGSGGKPALP